MNPRFVTLPLLAILASLLILAACGDGGRNSPNPEAAGAVTLRLGYFPNVTHAQALVGVSTGMFAQELGENVKLDARAFNAGPSVIEALFAGEIDASYIGPNPAINGFVRSNGEILRIISGSASGGALLIVRPEANIRTPADLANKKIASPQLGNTQDVALRAYIEENGLTLRERGGTVSVLPAANADILTLFRRGEIDGAWVPEPWATRLVVEASGKVFLDEKDLWPDGKFVTTHVIVRTKFLEQNPEAVERLLRAHVKTTTFINDNPDQAKAITNDAIREVTTASLPQDVINGAWANLDFTWDPIASSLLTSAEDAYELGLLGRKKPDLEGIYSLDLLNKVLAEFSLPPVKE